MDAISPSAPRKRPLQKRAQDKVQAILTTVSHILVTEGYDALTTNRVAQLAGISIGSLYQYFPNKESLIVAVRRQHADAMRALILTTSHTLQGLPLEGAVSLMVNAIVQAHQIDPALHRALEHAVPHQAALSSEDDLNPGLRDILRGLLTHYQAQGQIHVPDTDVASLVLVSTVDALVHLLVFESHSPSTANQIQSEIKRLVLAYLRA